MDNVVKLRQGDTYTHIYIRKNPSLLRKPLTTVYTQDDFTIMGSMVCKADLMMSQIYHGYPTVWYGGLDVATGPKFGTLAKDAENDIQGGEARKKIGRTNKRT